MRDTYLMYVDAVDGGTQSNKFYNMFPQGNTFKVEYGRMGSTVTTRSYPISKWNSTYKSKTRKGYKDITDLKTTSTVKHQSSGNQAFDDFFNVFKKYTGDAVKTTYLGDSASQAQIDEVQNLINQLTKKKVTVVKANDILKEIYRVIPRRMTDVRRHLITDIKELKGFIQTEQDAIDAMDSSVVMNVSNPFSNLGVTFDEVLDHTKMEDLLYPTMGQTTRTGSQRAKIHKVYAINDQSRTDMFNDWVADQKYKDCQLLIHGTRNANVFGIMKSGLLIRPANAYISGAVYGNGIYHSAHSAKSLGYTGGDRDKLFFIQNVHMGNHYTYSGWYRDGKDISRSEMNYADLQKKGYDSLYVKAGDGLLNSEYIVYNTEQTNTEYLVWMKS